MTTETEQKLLAAVQTATQILTAIGGVARALVKDGTSGKRTLDETMAILSGIAGLAESFKVTSDVVLDDAAIQAALKELTDTIDANNAAIDAAATARFPVQVPPGPAE